MGSAVSVPGVRSLAVVELPRLLDGSDIAMPDQASINAIRIHALSSSRSLLFEVLPNLDLHTIVLLLSFALQWMMC